VKTVKSGSGSATAFGRVLQAVRKRSGKSQADVAGAFDPKLSIAAISMAESGSRPPKTDAQVRGYARALELDQDDLVELWWAMQGMVEVEDRTQERNVQKWWRQLRADEDVELDWYYADRKAAKKRTPNDNYQSPSEQLAALGAAIRDILRRLLGDTWIVTYTLQMGLHQHVDGYPAVVDISLHAAAAPDDGRNECGALLATITCPEPVARPIPPGTATRPGGEALTPDVAWILTAVEGMPARERAAVAGFIHGIKEGANLYTAVIPPSG
jgi:transcriptional regulator with XRE-family HTH domain